MTDVSESAKPSQWNLLIANGDALPEKYPVTKDITTIGRDQDNDVLLDHMQISRHHARLNWRADFLLIEDLQSANGTSLNGEPLETPQAVKHGDVIVLGPFAITVETIGHREREQTDIPVAVPPAAAPAPRRRVWPVLLIVALLLLGVILLMSAVLAGRWLFVASQPAATVQPASETAAPQVAINQAPAQNSQVMLNHSVTVQATAFAAGGVSRLELWVNDQRVDSVKSPVNQSATSMTATFEWIASTTGPHVLDIHAYSESGQLTVTQAARITVIGGTETATILPLLVETPTPTVTSLPPSPTLTFTPPPTETPIPETPTPTPPPTATPAAATLTVSAGLLNVRAGPGTQYPVLGGLPQRATANVVGQATAVDGIWWQIEFAPAPNGLGWVSGNPAFVVPQNTASVPAVSPPALPVTASPTAPPPPAPTATASPTAPPAQVIRAPAGQTLLLIENRSLSNQPARLTLSGGKSVGGGKEIDPPAGGQVQLVLEPDFYRALWSAPWNSFTRGQDFTAVPGKVVVMWIVPENGITQFEQYDEIVVDAPPAATPAAPAPPPPGGLAAPPGKALLVLANHSVLNEYGQVTISGGSMGGGQLFVIDAATETQLELLPGDYRTVWYAPANGGVGAGREFTARAGDVIYGWIVPEDRTVFMQFPGQPVIQINN